MKSFCSILLGFLTAVLVIVIAMAVSVNTLIENYGKNYITTVEDASAFTAVIVPGARVYSDGTLSQSLTARLDLACELYNNGKAGKILISGDHIRDDYDEITPMLNYLLEQEIPAEDIFADHAGIDTYNTMYRAANVYGIRDAVVASQHYHNVRTIYIGHQLGVTTYAVDAEDYGTANQLWMNLREYGARLKAFIQAGILKPESKILEEPIPINSDGTITHEK